MPDFTPNTYKLLLSTLLDQNYSFQPFIDFIRNPESRAVILRHDVDARKMNSLRTAILENELGIRGTYYFRMVPESFDVEVIKKIADLGHEIGYHYEDLSFTAKMCTGAMAQWRKGAEAQRPEKNPLLGEPVPPKREARGGFDIRRRGAEAQWHSGKNDEELLAKNAIENFRDNLEKLRRILPVETICMHGSPLSRWDNRLLWKYYDYRDFGIVGEPYFDIDFEKVLYLTDTGRRWDGVAIRDKVTGVGGLRDRGTKGRRDTKEGGREEEKRREEVMRRGGDEGRGREEVMRGRFDKEKRREGDKENRDNAIPPSPFPPLTPSLSNKFHSTFDIIDAAKGNRLPDQIMLTVHPQRWDDRPLHWVRELIWQNVKNIIKLVVARSLGE